MEDIVYVKGTVVQVTERFPREPEKTRHISTIVFLLGMSNISTKEIVSPSDPMPSHNKLTLFYDGNLPISSVVEMRLLCRS